MTSNDNTLVDPFHGDAEPMKPADRHWEAARSLRSAVNWNSNSSVEHIAIALAAAEREGMERAAGIVRGIAVQVRHQSKNDMELAVARAINTAADAILSELPSTQTTPSVSEQAGEAISAVSPATPYDPFVARHVDPSRAV